jgi:hypothetical protein
MDTLISSAPLYFFDGLSAASSLLESDPRGFAQLLSRVGRGGSLPAGAGTAVEYVVLGARRLKVSDPSLVVDALARHHTPASAALAQALAQAAVAGGGSEGGSQGSSAGVPRLLGVDWALTLPVATSASSSGSSSAGAGAPGVTLQLRVELPQGGTATKAVHLTVAQLALMEASVREAALSLERA